MHFKEGKLVSIAIGAGMSLAAVTAHSADVAKNAPVTIICEHGSAKSLIAATLFNEAAKTRGLFVRAVSRGVCVA